MFRFLLIGVPFAVAKVTKKCIVPVGMAMLTKRLKNF